jgi:V/A-type H+-transporting ATPase subunit E
MDEKVQNIIKKIEGDSKAEVENILKEAKKQASEIVEEAEEKAKTIEEEILRRGERDAEQEKLRIVANAKLKSRKMILDGKEEVISEAFSKAREILQDIGASDKYYDVLRDLIKEAAVSVGDKEIILLARKEDHKILTKNFLKKLSKELDCQLALDSTPIKTMGGVVCRSKDGRIEVDNTLETRLERMKEDLRPKVAKILFGGGPE